MGRVSCATDSTLDPAVFVMATVLPPRSRMPAIVRTRSSLAPDCDIAMAADPAMSTPAPIEKTDGGKDVTGTASSRMNS